MKASSGVSNKGSIKNNGSKWSLSSKNVYFLLLELFFNKLYKAKLLSFLLSRAFQAQVESEEVQCFPFYAIVNALGIKHIDYFSLDVEGLIVS